MSAGTDRRWAELARELEFSQLDVLRKQAEGWRNGLLGLTALVTVVTALKGRDDLSALEAPWRTVAVWLLVGAFLLLLAGSLFAVRASFGRPGERVRLGGQALREWTLKEIGRVRRAVYVSAVALALGVALVVGALFVSWTRTEEPAADLVKVTTPAGPLCGELVSYQRDKVTLIRTTGGTERQVVVRGAEVRKITPAKSC
ncbi:hypothetical protein E5083_14350 [Streptomyces bauhiniae]|uniref:Uncharacterized protein n=1 Tax=Streptomyces bauhiniae TaxID=2340725 RepID=A0A4Z1D3L0_9ACTN|nr:hypothetical protein [Streptomyces bauhiniae]TGN76379.1 hypothetical protein E5083_14350 [Streptomyces bauhiniae]